VGPVIGSLNSRSCSIGISASRAALKASPIDRTSQVRRRRNVRSSGLKRTSVAHLYSPF